MAMDDQERSEDQTSLMDGVMLWAQRERRKAEFTKTNAERLNIENPSKYVLGQIINIIINDDSNCFRMEQLENTPLYPQVLKVNRLAILERLDWESSSTEVPENIRGQLIQTKEFIKGQDWVDKETFYKASKRWHDIQRLVRQQTGEDESLQVAVNYYRANLDLVSREYIASGGK